MKVKDMRDDISEFLLENGMTLEVPLERNPLIDMEFFDQEEEFVTPIKLKFEFDEKLGRNGSFKLVSKVNILEED